MEMDRRLGILKRFALPYSTGLFAYPNARNMPVQRSSSGLSNCDEVVLYFTFPRSKLNLEEWLEFCESERRWVLSTTCSIKISRYWDNHDAEIIISRCWENYITMLREGWLSCLLENVFTFIFNATALNKMTLLSKYSGSNTRTLPHADSRVPTGNPDCAGKEVWEETMSSFIGTIW
jgi:hypothetical protein